ncbi:methyltransferase domain-containing protein [Plectosphaerella cucumerina]|uniref:Methyltransferase domain-containing protein n=1 Tax=Plectosphaerella cucumerina TaxID=40658 RepID=A0A8K0TFL2_9PEZI|nr:methyltransferase domain-containing protein [Plectosphaerella cucumerina]
MPNARLLLSSCALLPFAAWFLSPWLLQLNAILQTHYYHRHHAAPTPGHRYTMTDTAGVNRAYFNKLASDYDSRFEKTVTQLIDEIQKRRYFISVDWIEDDSDDEDEIEGRAAAVKDKKDEQAPIRLLDYACGTGLVSRALAQYTTQCVGIDLSENMAGAYNARAENQGLSKDEMYAYHGILTDPKDPNPEAFTGPEFFNFDVAAVGLGFHHFDDPGYAAKQLAARLKPCGVLFILDFLPHAPAGHGDSHGHSHSHSHGGAGHGHDHGHSHSHADAGDDTPLDAVPTVMHHGFSEEQVRTMFENAGVGKDFALAEMGDGVVFHNGKSGESMKRRIFLARGVKA